MRGEAKDARIPAGAPWGRRSTASDSSARREARREATARRCGSAPQLTWACAPIGIRPGTALPSPWRLEEPTRKSRSDGSAAEVQLASGTAGHEPRPPARAAIQTSATLPASKRPPAVPSQGSTRGRRPRVVNPPTIAPACAAAERRHLGVWSACAAEGKCIAPNAHIYSYRALTSTCIYIG